MQIRPLIPQDMDNLIEIDGTIESTEYLHVERSGEGLAASWKVEPRRLREKSIVKYALDDERAFAVKQIVSGAEEGIAIAADYDGHVVASAAARIDAGANVLALIDLRVDYEYRRQGLGSGLIFQVIQSAREKKMRAVSAFVPANNFPAHQFVAKFGFELAGLDTHLNSNHDLVKEMVTLFWYLTLE